MNRRRVEDLSDGELIARNPSLLASIAEAKEDLRSGRTFNHAEMLESFEPVSKARFEEIEAFALRIYTPAGWREFLDKPQPVFGGRSARELLDACEYDAVMSALAADHEGAGF